MTTIPNLNIVVQQTGKVQETHNLRNQPHEVAVPLTKQELKNVETRTTVQHTDESDKLNPDRHKKKGGNLSKKKKKKKLGKQNKQDKPDGSGSILNTIA